MGLIRYSRPKDATVSGNTDWTPSEGVAADAWDLINDEFRTYTVRGTGGGVETDPADDAKYIEWDGTGGAGKHTFGFDLIGGDDDISQLIFHVRAWVSTGPVAPTLTLGRRVSGVDTDIGTVGPILTGTPTNYTLTTSVDGSGASWSTAVGANSLSSDDQEFYISAPSASYTVRVSRIYVEAKFVVGATLGKSKIMDNWRYCDICGIKNPYSRTKRPKPPHPKAGLVVCLRCYDNPDHEMNKILSRKDLTEETDVLY